MSAPDNLQSLALHELMRLYGWTRFAILVDTTPYGMIFHYNNDGILLYAD